MDKRINKSINSLISATYIQNEKLPKEYKNEEDFQNIAKANYASATDLIKRRNLIKGKILNSNANTLVTIAGDTMTVLEAIDRKTSIAYEQLLVNKLSSEYTKASRHVDMTNMEQDSEASNKINGITSSKDESSKELIKAITDLYEGKIPPTVVLVEIAQIAEALPIGEEKCGCESYSRHFDVLAQQVEQLANTQQYIGSKPLNVIMIIIKICCSRVL